MREENQEEIFFPLLKLKIKGFVRSKGINYHQRKKQGFKMDCGEFRKNKKNLSKSKIKGFIKSKGINYHWEKKQGFKKAWSDFGKTENNKGLGLSNLF